MEGIDFMEYDLVRYKYGRVHRYTAFCLTPKLAEPRVVTMGGKTFKVFNEGTSSRYAKHFERPSSAMGHLGTTGQSADDFDWSLLPGTVERHPDDISSISWVRGKQSSTPAPGLISRIRIGGIMNMRVD
jgi:hypothetical protein